MALSEESIKRLTVVKNSILAQPQYYYQDAWVSKIEPCGTTCCIAGWADFVVNGKKAHEDRVSRIERYDLDYEWGKAARVALLLTPRQTKRLTAPADCWPSPFNDDYYSARTAKQKAKVAAARIEHFIATGGEE